MKPWKIRSARKKLHVTQAQFACRLGISRSQLSRIERGISMPSEDVARKIVAILQEHQPPATHQRDGQLAPPSKQRRPGGFGKKIAHRTAVASFVLACLTFLVSLVGTAMREPSLSVQVSNGETGALTFVNTGKSTITIERVDPDLWHTCLIDLLSNSEDLAIYIIKEQSTALDARTLANFDMAEGLRLTRDERWEQQFFSRPTSRGTFCAYDLHVAFHFQPTSFWEAGVLRMATFFGFVDPKTEVFIRFDGCQFVQMSRQVFDQRRQAAEKELVVSRLKECLRDKHPDHMKRIADIEQTNREVASKIQEQLHSWPNEAIIHFSIYTLNKFRNATKDDERVRLLMVLWEVYEVGVARNLRAVTEPLGTFKDKEKFLIYFLGLDVLPTISQ